MRGAARWATARAGLHRLIARTGGIRRDRRGAVTILAAAGMLIAMGGAAFAVDMGAVYYESRRLQGVADAAALAAAGNMATAVSSAQAAIASDNWSRVITPVITTGVYTPDPTKTVAQRFVPTAASPNAAKAVLTANTPLYFGRAFGIQSIRLQRTATAARIDLASFSIGSRLASLNQGVANQLLSGLTGSSVNLTVADYNALTGVDLDLLSYVSALKSELNLSTASFDQVLATQTTLPHMLNALQSTLNAAGNAAAALAVAKVAATATSTSIVPSALVTLGQLGSQDHVAQGSAINVNAYNTLTSLLEVAGGSRQINLDLGSSIAGLTGLTAAVVMGDRLQNSPWIAVTNTGSPVVSTAQTRIYLQATALGTPALAALGIGSIRLPLYIELAPAQATLSSLSCTQAARSATLNVQTSIGHASIADISTSALSNMAVAPTESPATIVNILNIAKVTGLARIDLSSNGWQTVSFNTSEINAQTTKTVTSSGTVGAVVASLIGQITLTATIGPLQIVTPSLAALVKPLLVTVAPLVDGVLGNLLDMLGIHLGQADVRINGVRCGNASLVA